MPTVSFVAMSARRFCRFLGALFFIVHVQGVPVPPSFLPPHLFLLNKGEAVPMDQDIVTFLKAVPCKFDLVIDFLFRDVSMAFFPRAITPDGYHIYNSNIYLLSMINARQLTEKMCRLEILKDFTSIKFCDDLAMEEYFVEEDFVSISSAMGSRLGFTELTDVAKGLKSIGSPKECDSMCGGRYMSSLCRMFTALSHFFVKELKNRKWCVSDNEPRNPVIRTP